MIALVDAPTIRAQLARLAHRVLDDAVPDQLLPILLGTLLPQLEAEAAVAAFESLCEAIVLRDTVSGGQEGVNETLDILMRGVPV